jgi:hypothetical protein
MTLEQLCAEIERAAEAQAEAIDAYEAAEKAVIDHCYARLIANANWQPDWNALGHVGRIAVCTAQVRFSDAHSVPDNLVQLRPEARS